MYTNHADIYDLIYSFKNYRGESELIYDIIRKNLDRNNDIDRELSVIELGIGTGNHMCHLFELFEKSKEYDRLNLIGLDKSSHMLEIAEKKIAEKINESTMKTVFITKQDDMANFTTNDVQQQFDIVLSLFGCLGYLKSTQELIQTLTNMFVLVRPRGLVIIEPFIQPELFKYGTCDLTTYEDSNYKIARLGKVRRMYKNPTTEDEKNRVQLTVNYSIGKMDFGQELFVEDNVEPLFQQWEEKHDMLMFSSETIINCCKQVGFNNIQLLKQNELQQILPNTTIRDLYVLQKN
ncbi:unnamed protein product [Didymodactylos carnosus]|uniref:Methyltransferase domain-containing protein n=1 Tax=Didymodactylos carnosus TaxID=1234261 RepID=A0A8S2N1Q0_9BILA|nr:unnamed protein product [Didymodactylos carnosus]CAF3983831.1 unnamed protein product [Didymodactylos carnosus]